jgi:hypothetical protein
MDFNLLQQLQVPSDINPNDLKLITEYAAQIQNGKIPKVSLEERNKLKSLIAKYGPKEEEKPPQKDMKDMTPEEKEVYRNELKRRLREKRNTMTNMRQSKHVIERNMNKSKTNTTTTTTTNTINRQVAPNLNNLQNMDLSSLTNMINELQNGRANDRQNSVIENKEDENLEDFLK